MHLALAAADHPPVPLSQIAVPTAFVAGRYDVLASSRDIRAAAERRAGATYVELWGTHYLPLERSAEVTELLRELVERAGAA
jgi:pimeloyl-ACP methyl ester carboxylesterase